jgi:TRAP-type C4-dicarboxylate transport system permease small subunit
MKFFFTICDYVALLTSVLSRLMLIGVAAILILQVILRYCFSYSLPWPEEASRYLMIWVVMLSGSLLVKDNELVRVDFLDGIWREHWLVYRNVLFRILLSALLLMMARYGWDQAYMSINRTTTALQISWFWPYLAIPAGTALMLLQMIALTLSEFKSRKRTGLNDKKNAERIV